MTWPVLELWWLIPVAVGLDYIFGDPPMPWGHPVRLIGRVFNYLEKWARSVGSDRVAGLVCLVLVAGVAGYAVRLLCAFPGAGIAAALYFSYAGLAFGCLLREGRKVLDVIENGTLDEARRALSMLVSRDTSMQDASALRRSLADTLSENFTDAFVAPLFWLCFTGPAGLWMYKTVSTMDSMWGYKTPEWRDLGFAGARLDDILAYIPARLSVVFIRLASIGVSWTMPGGSWPGFATIFRQAAHMESPNSGCSMTALAWLAGTPMGGPTVYFGELKDKPWLGPWFAPGTTPPEWTTPKLEALMDLMKYAALWGTALTWGFSTIILHILVS